MFVTSHSTGTMRCSLEKAFILDALQISCDGQLFIQFEALRLIHASVELTKIRQCSRRIRRMRAEINARGGPVKSLLRGCSRAE
jgi:hypothetical protein